MSEAPEEPRQLFHIHALAEEFLSAEICQAVAALAEALSAFFVNIVLHFRESPTDWGELLRTGKALVGGGRGRGQELRITLEGPLSPLSADVKAEIFVTGLRLVFSEGVPGCSPPTTAASRERLRDLAAFGLLAPLALYITGDNVRDAEAAVEDALDANYYSGFSLQLACEHLRFDLNDPTRPAPGGCGVHRIARYDAQEPFFRVTEFTKKVFHAAGEQRRHVVRPPPW